MANTKQPPRQQEAPPSLSLAHDSRTLAKPNPVSSWKGPSCSFVLAMLLDLGPSPRSLSASASCLSLLFQLFPSVNVHATCSVCGILHTRNPNPAGLIPPFCHRPMPVDAESPRFSCKPGPATNRKAPGGSVLHALCETVRPHLEIRRGQRAVLGLRLTRRSHSHGLFPQNLADCELNRAQAFVVPTC